MAKNDRHTTHKYSLITEQLLMTFLSSISLSDLANNKLKTMEGLKGLSNLRKIDLGANRIRAMDVDELNGLINLEELWLGKNKIEKIQGLEKLTKLRRLDVQSNRLTEIEGLASIKDTLEELYLASNAITAEGASTPTGLAMEFPVLTVLDLSKNRLTTTKPFAHLKSLEELWLSGNKVATFGDVQPISTLQKLDTIYLEYNPVYHDPMYRKRLAEIIPSLKQIDANLIGSFSAHGIPPAPGAGLAETEEQRLRRLQEAIIERAKAETKGNISNAK
jgi:protein phosphatase 1 regulatory subunit 7